MEEVAGVLIGDSERRGPQLHRQAEGDEEFSDVEDFAAEFFRTGGFGIRIGEKMPVFLKRGATAGGVGEDSVKVFGEEGREIFSGNDAGGFAVPGMGGESAAAELMIGNDDFDAVGHEDAEGGFIERGESDIGDAAGEEGDTRAALTAGRKGVAEAAEEEFRVDGREERFFFSEAKELKNSRLARERLQAGTLVEAEEAGDCRDAPRVRQELAKDEVAREARQERAPVVAPDAGAGVFDELAVLDAGGAGGFAGAAVEAFVDVVDEAGGDRLLAVFDVDHLADAAAGRIGFEVPEAVGGASIVAEAAVDTAGVVLISGTQAGNFAGSHGMHDVQIIRDRLGTKALRRLVGSAATEPRCIRSSEPGASFVPAIFFAKCLFQNPLLFSQANHLDGIDQNKAEEWNPSAPDQKYTRIGDESEQIYGMAEFCV